MTRHKKNITFEQNPLKYFLCKCDAEASKMREQIQGKSNEETQNTLVDAH